MWHGLKNVSGSKAASTSFSVRNALSSCFFLEAPCAFEKMILKRFCAKVGGFS